MPQTNDTNRQESARYDSTRRAWEDIWDGANVAVELDAVQYRRAQATLNAYLPYLNRDDLILEAGSGLSAVVIEMKRMGYEVIGLDYAENALHVSRDYEPGLKLVAGDVHKLPFAENSLGAYLSFGVLEHFEHGMQPGLLEAYRILKPGGVLVLTIPYPNIVWRLAQWKRQRAGQQLINEDFYESTYSRKALVANVEQAGFDLIKAIPTSHSFTFWGLGGPFQAEGYYQTSFMAELFGDLSQIAAPWLFNFMTLIIASKPGKTQAAPSTH
ncbi:class I SAM-dependent methyltransferase [Phototrophicus methaneseepsis]|uniref:Class I SAM-dependent methyltransferase n=1 Tax=Phototrophicus methaneseepsis TaxID=2710758 RepID=A0A7S8IDH2_9CHLR|nr:class I SAM-dependent methyltransferase [Phototrophicus methaneseepsis]QPC82590.1 class I SAM-dependent methyltransferase [Phototrophicus methaneseepsis]